MGNQVTISGTAPTLVFAPNLLPNGKDPVWWKSAAATLNPGTNLSYGGKVTFRNTPLGASSTRNQVLSFCYSTDGKTIVFADGAKWTRTGN